MSPLNGFVVPIKFVNLKRRHPCGSLNYGAYLVLTAFSNVALFSDDVSSSHVNAICVFMPVVTCEPPDVSCSYGVSSADQQHQGQAPGNSCSKETAGGAHHESGKPGP